MFETTGRVCSHCIAFPSTQELFTFAGKVVDVTRVVNGGVGTRGNGFVRVNALTHTPPL